MQLVQANRPTRWLPGSPAQVNGNVRVSIPGYAQHVAHRDGVAYVASRFAGLHVVDVTLPAEAKIIEQGIPERMVTRMDLQGDRIALALWRDGVGLMNLASDGLLGKMELLHQSTGARDVEWGAEDGLWVAVRVYRPAAAGNGVAEAIEGGASAPRCSWTRKSITGIPRLRHVALTLARTA